MATETDRPNVLDGDTVRPLTDDELAQRQVDAIEAADRAAEAAARETARQSALAKLAALGLTDAEIAALVGA